MEITIKTKVGTVVFDNLEPGMSMDISINPGHPVKKARVSVSLYGFRSIQDDHFSGGTVSGHRSLVDDMVRVGVDIEYETSKDHVYLSDQEVPIKTKKTKFIDLSTYKVSK